MKMMLFLLLASMVAGQVRDEPLKRNVLILITDQQFADAMSCRMGKEYLETPAMDRLAAGGTLYSRAYCANPVCVPSRTAMFTGRYSCETGVRSNHDKSVKLDRFACLGTVFRKAGYRTGYFGKWHNPINLKDVKASGFERVDNIRLNGADLKNSDLAIEYLRKKEDKPFLLVVSYNNPHNICEWSRGARGRKLPDGRLNVPPSLEKLPPLPVNLQPPRHETDIMTLMRRSFQASKLFPVGKFGEKEWREYRWAYYRMVEHVDARIGRVLDALEETGQEEDTVILFTSDHGDCQGAHRWNQKTVFYDESSRVPFIITCKGVTSGTVSDELVNTGIDLFPTLCDYAGLPVPNGLPGVSLKPGSSRPARKYVVCQNHLVQGAKVDGRIPKPSGRMVRSDRYKYCLYSEGKRRESLVDMEKDPGEMANEVGDPDFERILREHRVMLREYAERHGDEEALRMLAEVK